MKMDTKKKSHTTSELSIIKGYLFRGTLTDHSPLFEWEAATESAAGRERTRLRGHTQVGG